MASGITLSGWYERSGTAVSFNAGRCLCERILGKRMTMIIRRSILRRAVCSIRQVMFGRNCLRRKGTLWPEAIQKREMEKQCVRVE